LALACVFALITSFMFFGEPVGLAAILIVGSLILRRAGPWWRRAPAPLALANA
jgi:arabinofuranan 3-O-arabinosyltransferase